MDVSHILESLNEKQREAVAAPPGSHLVLAGAGSGKTRVLVHRIAWLIETGGLSPYSILAVTFTNKAAAEMRGRIEALLEHSVRGMWVGTFHGIAHRLLRTHWEEAGLPQTFQILDADDQLRMVKRVIAALDLDEKKWPARQSVWWINSQKDEGLRPDNIEDYGDHFTNTQVDIYRAYEEACERGGLVDFAELLLRAHELWLNDARLLKHYQERFRYLLVDEFQDTNTIQYAWLRVLAGDRDNVMVVGDDDQSIYGWRGAKIENIHQFSEDFPESRIVRLEQNYRSTGNILEAANGLIAGNLDRLGKELWTDGVEGEPINLYAGYNDIDEARYIVDRIRKWSEDGNQRQDAAILYRSNAQSRVLEEALLRAKMPYRIYGGQRFFERAEIRNALSYMRLINTRDSDAAFERVVNTPPRGIGDRTIGEVRARARQVGCSLWQAAMELSQAPGASVRVRKALQTFIDFMAKLDEATAELSLEDLCEHVIEATGLKDYHGKEGGERGQARKENLEELINACRAFDPGAGHTFDGTGPEEDELTLLEEFLAHAALEAGDNQGYPDEDCVQMMTLHSAKGLEFPLVFVAGLEEGLFPSQLSMEEPGRLEEERRLCYVGITRARELLYLTYAENRRINGRETFNRPSRFVKEIPAGVLREVRVREVTRQRAEAPRQHLRSRVPANVTVGDSGISLGQRVTHKKFGEGVVTNYEGEGRHARVEVNFRDVGSKWLMLGYANLEPA